jgi:hypothetical protein
MLMAMLATPDSIRDRHFIHLETYFDQALDLGDRQGLANLRVEEISQQGRADGPEVEFRMFDNAALGDEVQLVQARDRLDEAWRMGDAQGA